MFEREKRYVTGGVDERIPLDLQCLLDGFEPVPATVIEVRNYIAHPNKHDRQSLEFCELKVQI